MLRILIGKYMKLDTWFTHDYAHLFRTTRSATSYVKYIPSCVPAELSRWNFHQNISRWDFVRLYFNISRLYVAHGSFFSILSNMTCARVCIPHSSSDVSGKIHRLLVENEMLYSDCRFSLVDRHHFQNFNASYNFIFCYNIFVDVHWLHELIRCKLDDNYVF